MSDKKVIFVDMDGVIVDFMGYVESHGLPIEDVDKKVDFAKLEPIIGAIESTRKLITLGYDVFIATTAPWDNIKAFSDKRRWIGEHLPEMRKKLIITHRKDMLIGDYLIDDRLKNGVSNFKGMHLHFGKTYPDWDSVLSYFSSLKSYEVIN